MKTSQPNQTDAARSVAAAGGARHAALHHTLLKVIARIPGTPPRVVGRLARYYSARGEHALAAHWYRRALRSAAPGQGARYQVTAGLHHDLGMALLQLGDHAGAECAFREAFALRPDASWSLQGLAEALTAQDRLQEAEAALRQALALTPSNRWLRFHLSGCLFAQQRRGEALDLVLAPTDRGMVTSSPILSFPAAFLTEDDCTSARIECARRLARAAPTDQETLLLLGWMLSLRGEYAEATEAWRQLSALCWPGFRGGPPDWGGRTKPPSFLILGQSKAGTTALWTWLCQHPLILPPPIKEPHYWTHHQRGGDAWYHALFPPIPRDAPQITGEASTDTLTNLEDIASLARALPAAKLIVLLRDPVARAYSHYQMYRRIGWEPRAWDEAINEELARIPECPLTEAGAAALPMLPPGNYLRRGIVLPFLRRWLQYYPKEQLLILHQADLLHSTPATVERVVRFLGLPTFTPDCQQRVNRDPYPPMGPAIAHRLRDWYAPHQAALAEFLAEWGARV